MKIGGRKSYQSAGNGENPFSDASSYEEKARAYCVRSGRQDGSHPVIVAGTREWALWMEYFDHIGHSHAKPNSYANSKGRLTVPANTPDAFEPGWRASDSFADKNSPVSKSVDLKPYVSPEEKAASKDRVAAMYQSFRSGVDPSAIKGSARDRRDAEAEKQAARVWLEEHKNGEFARDFEASDRLTAMLNEMFPEVLQAAE